MKENEIIEGNKLIAEFDKRLFYGHTIDKFGVGTGNALPEMEYHSSWDWLMPVVEKISEYRYPEYFKHFPDSHERDPFEDCAYPRTFGMRDKEGNYMVRLNANTLITAPTLKEAVWLAVIDFINWHNTHTPPPSVAKGLW